MRVLLECGYFRLLSFKLSAGLIRIRFLFEGGSLSRIYGNWIFCLLSSFYFFVVRNFIQRVQVEYLELLLTKTEVQLGLLTHPNDNNPVLVKATLLRSM